MRTEISIALLMITIGVSSAQDLEIVNVRVGQGDATLIKGPADASGNQFAILVDAGNIRGRDGGNILRAVLSKRGVDKLDLLISTHYDADHIGGIIAGGTHASSFLLGFNNTPGSVGDDDNDGDDGWVGREFFAPDPDELGTDDDLAVGFFVDRGDKSRPFTQAFEKYRAMAEAKGNRTSITNQQEVENFVVDIGDGAILTMLAANGFVRDRASQVANVNTENERSLSMLIEYDEFHYLISGDLSGRTSGSENAMVERAVGEYLESQDILVDVLHVNHHGANNSSEMSFLEAIQPTIAVISAGNANPFAHPRNEVLNRLEEAGVYRIIQTSWGTTSSIIPNDVRGIHAIYQNDVVIHSDGETYTVSTSRTFESDVNPRTE